MDEVRQTISIPLDHILERDGFNARTAIGDVYELAKAIQSLGVLYPPLVVRADDRPPISETECYFYIIHGHRRVRAMRELKWTKGPFFVAPPDVSLLDQLMLNLAENIREEITITEIAERRHRIIESARKTGEKVTSEKLAETVGYSASYLRNLLKIRRDLHPELWALMVKLGNHAPVFELLRISHLPLEKQQAEYDIIATAIQDVEGIAAKAGRPPRPKRQSWRAMAAELLKEAPPNYQEGARWLFEELGARHGRSEILRALWESKNGENGHE